MAVLKEIFSKIVEYLGVLVGLLFIFVLGSFYALLQPEGLLISGIFLLIGIGWIAFLIKHFWDLIAEDKTSKNNLDDLDL